MRGTPYLKISLTANFYLSVEVVRRYLVLCCSCYNLFYAFFLQIAAGDGAESRERIKEFTFDYSYWSHRDGDKHFAPQVSIFEFFCECDMKKVKLNTVVFPI